MTSPSLDLEDGPGGWEPRRRRRGRWQGPVVLALAVGGVAALLLLRGPTIGEHASERKILHVVLPPPPAPPPPPPPREKPPEPKETPKVVEQPVAQPTPTPPQPSPAPSPQANDALTARAGPAAGNFGLAVGNGSGVRIGGKPGGDAFAAYGGLVLSEARAALQRDPTLNKGRYTVKLRLSIGPDGSIREIQIESSEPKDPRRDAEIQRLLLSQRFSQPPPPGLPAVRIELSARPGL